MSNAINEEIVHINGHPQNLIVFLHGYIDNADYLEKSIASFIDSFPDTAVHLPQAPLSCEILDDKRQWYSMHRFDPDDARKTVPTMQECVDIYNSMSLGLYEAFSCLDSYLDSLLDEYGLSDENLYLCGFSQGAMLALYTSLMRQNKIGGCISFSGILAAHEFLKKHYNNTPDTLLIHGNNDNLVRFDALDFTKKNLKSLGCKTESVVIDGGQHRISEEGLSKARDFILKRMRPRGKVAI